MSIASTRSLLSLAVALLPLWMASTVPANILINEVDRHTQEFVVGVNEDALDFIELYNDSPAPASLDGMVLVLYQPLVNNNTDAIDLTGYSIPAGGYFVIGSPGVPNVNLVKQTGAVGKWLQAWAFGGTGIALFRNSKAADFPSSTPIPNSLDPKLVDALVVTATGSPDPLLLAALTPSQPDAREGSGAALRTNSVARSTDGAPAASPLRNTSAYVASIPTPGRSNANSAATATTPSLPDLKVEVTPVGSIGFLTAAENGGTVSGSVTVTRRGPVTSAVTVTLSSSDPTECTVSDAITIPAGSASATKTVTFALVDDLWKDGDQIVYLRADAPAPYQQGTGWLKVTDNDAANSSPLVINEVNGTLWNTGTGSDPNEDGTTSAADDFIEIINTSSNPADCIPLIDYTLTTSTGEWIKFPPEAVVLPGASVLIFSQAGADRTGTTARYGTALVFQTGGTRTINDSRDWISLKNASNQEIAGHVFEPAQVGSNSRTDAVLGNPFGGESGHGKLISASSFGAYTSAGSKIAGTAFYTAKSPSLASGRKPDTTFAAATVFSELEADGSLVVRVARPTDSASTAYDLPVRLRLNSDDNCARLLTPGANFDYIVTIPTGQSEVFVPLGVLWDIDDNPAATPVNSRKFSLSIVAAGLSNTTSPDAHVFDESFTVTTDFTSVSELEGRLGATVTRAFGRTEAIPLKLSLVATGPNAAGAEFIDGGVESLIQYSGKDPVPQTLKLLADNVPLAGPDRAFRLDLSGSGNLLQQSQPVIVLNDGFEIQTARTNGIWSELETTATLSLVRPSGVTRPVTVTVALTAQAGCSEFKTEAAGNGTSLLRTITQTTLTTLPLPLQLFADALHGTGPDRTFSVTATSSGLSYTSPTFTSANDYITAGPGTAVTVASRGQALSTQLTRPPGRSESISAILVLESITGTLPATLTNGSAVTMGNTFEVPLTLTLGTGTDRIFSIKATSNDQTQLASAAITVSDATKKLLDWAAGKGLPVGSDVKAFCLADPDGDGIPNLLEYVGDSHPLQNEFVSLPTVSLTGNQLALSFPLLGPAATDSDLMLGWQASAGLDAWTRVAPPSAAPDFKPDLTVNFENDGSRHFYRVTADLLP
jgi:hypothetical protein